MTLGWAALLVLIVHLGFAFLVVLSFEGPLKWCDTSVSYWGSIVRREELSPKRGSAPLNEMSVEIPVSLTTANARFITWELGLGLDKPTMLSSVQNIDTLEKIKFTGPKVILDDRDAVSSQPPAFDLPVPTNIHLRYPRP